MSAFWIASAATLAFVGVMLAAELSGRPALVWIAKPLASLSFIAAAYFARTPPVFDAYTIWIFVGLALSLAGDVLLIPKKKAWFTAGLGAFLLAHVAYVVAFAARGVSAPAIFGALVLLGPLSLAVARWLWPHVSKSMRAPVAAYSVVITVMVACAVGTVAAHGRAIIFAAAFAFYLSDLSVARDRFVSRGFINRAWGLPLYYVAQLMFAVSVGD